MCECSLCGQKLPATKKYAQDVREGDQFVQDGKTYWVAQEDAREFHDPVTGKVGNEVVFGIQYLPDGGIGKRIFRDTDVLTIVEKPS